MSPYYLNPPSDSQGPGYEFVLPTQCIGQDFRVTPSLQPSSSEYHLATSQQSYSFVGQELHGTCQALQIPRTNSTRSLRPPVGSGTVRAPSLSSHPYHQAKLCHIADRASSQHQECSRLPFQTFPALASTSGTVIPYNTAIGSRASTRDPNSSQLPLVANKFTPSPIFAPASHSNVTAPNTNQNITSSMGSLTVPGQTQVPTYQTPAPPPYPLADEADIEYAQYRYGDKCCFYQCRFDLLGSPCNQWIVGDRTRVLRHLRNHHHLQTGPAAPAFCRWDECTHSRPMKQENLSRHVVMHLGVKWKCPHCRRLFSRDDAVHRHIERMAPGMDVTDAEVVPGHDARALTEPQSKKSRIA
ncbi:hypothetical protein JVT61DRAFT_749 [Boletus reticuloceps]|uniref:C2H2-type domain-containing protein n=1 Tax=Boletus reticuloceps TaxID=495285 RepID=A0A8I2Z126_9AGAM|nr:hypothetical protein JVT61DRAFT_749 [Boletus reticuloceps]